MLFIVPSRNRPHKAAELIEAFATHRESAHLIFAVDHDDHTIDSYRQVIYSTRQDWCTIYPTKSFSMVSALNLVARHRAASYMHVGFMGDDHRPATIGFDAQLVAAIDEMGGGLAYADDKFQGANLPTQVVMSSKIINCLGFMAPPSLTHLYVDNYWKALGEGIGRISYCPHVVIRHDHPAAGRTEWDEGYVRVNAGEMYAKDEAAYNDLDMAAHIARVRKMYGGS